MFDILPLLVGFLILTVLIHGTGLTGLAYFSLTQEKVFRSTRPLRIGIIISAVAVYLLLLAAVEIILWGALYLWLGCFENLESSIYFSGVTYATIGYGDLVLPDRWRLLAPVQGLLGILLNGLSTAVFFAIISHIYTARFIK
jgi:hypothetical protein